MALDDAMAGGPVSQSNDAPQPGQEHHELLMRWATTPNIALELDDAVLSDIGARVKQEYEIDKQSRSDWETQAKAAMDLALQKAKEKQYPWPKAANVIYPLITTASIQFAARAYPAIIDGKRVAKGVVIGRDDGQPQMDLQTGQPLMNPQSGQPLWRVPPGFKQSRAERIGEHMSWQLLDEMPEWEPETDQLLHILPILGCGFRKTFFDPGKGRNCSLMVSPMRCVINHWAKSVETAPRLTEEVLLYPLEIIENERAKLFRKLHYAPPQSKEGMLGDTDAPREFLEQHRLWDLDGDGYPEPYIMTVHKDSAQVARIRARYDHDGVHIDTRDQKIARIEAIQYYTKYDFLPNPDGGIYGVGFGQLLKPINEAVNTTLNQLIDAGHLANTGGGFIGKGLSMNAGAVRFIPGEWKMINVAGGVIKDNMVPLQFPGPSNVLFQLLGMLIEAGKEIASVKDVLSGQQDQHNVPATTTLALIEQGLKVFTAIYKRVHRALKSELAKLYRLNFVYLPNEVSYQKGDEWKTITRADYQAGSGVEPVSDPTVVTDMQKMAKAQLLMPFVQNPLCNGQAILRRFFESAQIEKVDELIAQAPPPNPMLAVKGMELDIKAKRAEAEELKDLAQSILYFAQADKLLGDQHLAWVEQQLETWKAQYEAAAQSHPQPGGEGQPATPGGPSVSPPLGAAPGPSAAHPGAMPPTSHTEEPPLPGAVQTPQGGWKLNNVPAQGRALMEHQ